MSGSNPSITIPSVMVSQADGATFIANLDGLDATMRRDAVLPPAIDGDLNSDIVYHEYGHGLTWRMIGTMSGPQAGAIGEGASDALAFLVNGDDRIGEYSIGDAAESGATPMTATPSLMATQPAYSFTTMARSMPPSSGAFSRSSSTMGRPRMTCSISLSMA